MSINGILQSGGLEGFRGIKVIPLVIRYAAGTPSIVQNPTNEDIALTDTGTGDVLLTLANASLAPLIAVASVRPTAALTLGNTIGIKGAPTTTTVAFVTQDASDGATEVDAVDIDVILVKTVQG